MKSAVWVMTSVVAFALTPGGSFAAELPGWAYGLPPGATSAPPAAPAAPGAPDTTPKHLQGSSLSFTAAQIRDSFGPADWFPGDHPAMPDVVAHGKKPDVRACALCHYPNGKGRPENAPVTGYAPSYFIHQMLDFRHGNRNSSDPKKANTKAMVLFAQKMTDEEIKEAADYFGSMKWSSWIRVVETTTVPKTRVSIGMFLPLENGEKEPLGHRIIEVPENPENTEVLRDPHSGFIAYVPVGSVKKGQALVTNGAGKTTQCALCHGADLKGMGPVPGIAGRSPSYLVRQMFDMQQGVRKGLWSELMKPVVAKLSEEDMLEIAAYTASVKP